MATPGPIHDPRPAPGDPRPFALGDGRLIIPADEIDRIAADHPGWIGRAPGDGPLYALPHAAIDRMATARPRLGAALGRHEARAEARFTDLCLDAGCVGAWGGWLVDCQYLLPPRPFTAAGLASIGIGKEGLAAARRLIRGLDRPRELAYAYAGRLVVDPDFLGQRDHLRALWRDLPAGLRPEFPLPGLTCGHAPRAADRDGFGRFVADLGDFLRRWELAGMATWDLPLPRGPRLDADRTGRGTRLELPGWFPGDGHGPAHDLLRLRRPATPRFEHARLHASMLAVDFLERAIDARAPDPGRPPRGWVGLVLDAVADAMDVSTDHVRALRKAISACRRGRRDDVAIFRRGGRP